MPLDAAIKLRVPAETKAALQRIAGGRDAGTKLSDIAREAVLRFVEAEEKRISGGSTASHVSLGAAKPSSRQIPPGDPDTPMEPAMNTLKKKTPAKAAKTATV